MEETAALKGQLLIRSIIEEYRNLLEVLGNPQLLLKDLSSTTAPDGNLPSSNSSSMTMSKKTTQEILHKLTRLFSQLRTVYNECLDEMERYGGLKMLSNEKFKKERDAIDLRLKTEMDHDGPKTIKKAQLLEDVTDIKQKNNQLKGIIDEMRQLIWDIDIMKRL